GGYQLVEVKGPGDKLQANQIRWIRHFEQVELPFEVVNVQWR
ncbi:MAG: VRR-NUC domain-containing protein, partial [Gammaproteobacteria bacterium]|nr:VRR-NUC domain-containing protein [Gammaproteobacteria bacterium]